MNELKIVILFNALGFTINISQVHELFQIGSLAVVTSYTLYKFHSEYKRNKNKQK
jgi:hypothetical protein